jgi:hypothetical protein
MTMVGASAAEACVAAGGGEGTYTIRVEACRLGQPPMINARLHHKNGKALSFTSLRILSFYWIALPFVSRGGRGAVWRLVARSMTTAVQIRKPFEWPTRLGRLPLWTEHQN